MIKHLTTLCFTCQIMFGITAPCLTWSTVSQSSQIKKVIRLGVIQTQTKLGRKRDPKNQKKNFISKELRDTSNKPDKIWNTVKKDFTPQSQNLQNLLPLFVQLITKCLLKSKALLMDSVNSFLRLQIVWRDVFFKFIGHVQFF